MSKIRVRVSFSPDIAGIPPVYKEPYMGAGGSNCRKPTRSMVGIWSFRSPKNSAMRFLERIGAKVARALGFVSMNGVGSSRYSSSSSSSSAFSSSYSRGTTQLFSRSKSYNTYAAAQAFDSQRAEAIQDCIQFLNSSSCSTFRRSKSLSTTCSC